MMQMEVYAMPDDSKASYWEYDPPVKSGDSGGPSEGVTYYFYSKTKPRRKSADRRRQKAERYRYLDDRDGRLAEKINGDNPDGSEVARSFSTRNPAKHRPAGEPENIDGVTYYWFEK
jgi:hypothetical protein